jgi:hypothetical protein
VGLERGPLSLVGTTEEILDRKVAALVWKTENTAVGIRHADHVATFIRKSWQPLRREAAVARSVYSLADSDHGVFFCLVFIKEYPYSEYNVAEYPGFWIVDSCDV